MFVETDIGTFRIGFFYDPSFGKRLSFPVNPKESIIYTFCSIQKKNQEWINVAVGSAIKTKGDQFSKKLGRKIALTRALSNLASIMNFDRNTRKVFNKRIWVKYFETHSQ